MICCRRVVELASFLRYARSVRQTDSVEEFRLPNPLLPLMDTVVSTFSLLLERNDMPREGLRARSLFAALRGLGGEGERFLRLLRRAGSAKLERKAGSRRGGCATDILEVFFLRRGGDGWSVCWCIDRRCQLLVANGPLPF